ncbi:MAG: radical SAM family heme chaperone HemW [Paludibacter sp.]|nr:radical SAM family heme chaperone HemW [Bacteroidales bacterium]MCM1069492.1 radical SAM family heme chaperone HemW [Prevotella sp.]MCM1354148.1 radical SAM family heme chaperone HemW [Bacteroides sp.]MCM1442995.1 radical SAM family heme chaperone HemW [Muribaculum sp.]MCM1482223.1 radical SAM family heme chaperone HemW [Paludibacter sp.]
MAGIYLHIPFCKSRCKYCDFYSTTLLSKREEYVATLLQEIQLRQDYLPDKQLQTIYIGGGTPSLLTEQSLKQIIEQIRTYYDVLQDAEITLEANPGDLNAQKLYTLRNIGFNRLSIGIQSFQPHLLQLMGRRHLAEDAIRAVKQAQQQGFYNISIDLIYGLPNQTQQEWEADLHTALSLNVQHISTYCLSYENGTPFADMLGKGELTPIDDDRANQMYETAIATLQQHYFTHYEVSNFCKDGFRSRHNSSYWNNTPYIGIGAAAHSYNGQSRQWNIDNLQQYIQGVQTQCLNYEKEILTDTDRYNERVMLALRTAEGIDLTNLSNQEAAYCIEQAQEYIDNDLLELQNNHLTASLKGIELLNRITEKLIIA